MGVFRSVGRGLKSAFNVKRFMGADLLHSDAQGIKKSWEDLAGKNQPNLNKESFDAVVARLNLSASDLKAKAERLLLIAKIYLSCAMIVFIYSLFSLIVGHIAVALVSFVIVTALLSYAFREHFRRYQIQHRSLNVSVRSWFFNSIFKRGLP